MAGSPVTTSERLALITGDQAKSEWDRLNRSYSQLGQLREALPAILGANLSEADEQDPIGLRGDWDLDREVYPAGGPEAGPGVNAVKSALIVTSVNYGNNLVAMCASVLKGEPDGPEVVEAFTLQTSSSNFLDDVKEQGVSGGKLQPRSGFWDTLLDCLSRDCGQACLSAAVSCRKDNWADFLVCLAGRCGLCVVKCHACAGCKCAYWCVPVAGCCGQ